MRRKYLTAAVALAVVSSLTLSSCIGSFQLSNKILAWNQQISSKFVNELVFICFWIVPVYEISALADLIVINSIEFWSGKNPVEAQTTVIDGSDARYQVERNMAGYTITNISDGSVVRFDFKEDDNSWWLSTDDGDPIKIMEYVDDSHVRMLNGDGGFTQVDLSQEGVMAYCQMAMSGCYAMTE